MSRPSLDLFAEVITASSARFRWDGNQRPGSRLRNLSFRTKVGEGFSDAGGQLPRRIDQEYADVNLGDTVIITGADGDTAYEGTVVGIPLEIAETHSVGVTLAGFMAAAKYRKFVEVYVDRDLGAWGPISVARRANLLTGNYLPYPATQRADPTDSAAVVSTEFTGAWGSPYLPISETLYDPGAGVAVAKVAYGWKRAAGIDHTLTDWNWKLYVADDDKATNAEYTANLRAAGPATGQTFTPATPRRTVSLQLFFNGTPGGADGAQFALDWSKLAVYGNHGLTLHTGEPGEPQGVYASDVIRDIARRFCPQLDTSGVQNTSYVIQHLAFKDRTYPYDAFLEINKFHLWHLGVWEGQRLDFRPYDLSDYMWEVRTDEPGTRWQAQGPSTEDLFNGIVVSYIDLLTGVKQTLTPDTHPELLDTSEANPWNRHGVKKWFEELTLSTPTLAAQALQIGRAALAEKNRPKTPGTITRQGHVRDRAGNWQPGWKVRAGDTIAVTNFTDVVSDRPRLISETTWDAESRTVSISVDRPTQTLDALFDRQANALTARGLA